MSPVVWQDSPVGLESRFYADVETLLDSSAYTWYVTFACRSFAEQAALYQKHLEGGPLAAPPGQSAHNYGLAIDVCLDRDVRKPGLQMDWNTAHDGWKWLFDAVKKHPRLKSGVSFGDAPHIQSLLWKGGRYAASGKLSLDLKRMTFLTHDPTHARAA